MPRKGRKSTPTGHTPTEREQLQEIVGGSGDADSPVRRERVRILERDGDPVFVCGDAERHERRIQRVTPNASDRLFWVTIAIACGAPGRRDAQLSALKKEYGTLDKARNDLDAFYQYYRPTVIGDPRIVGVIPGLGKCPGYFDHAVHLDNPTARQLRSAVSDLRQWLTVNQHDPEYRSFQLNFCFSGHGDIDDDGHAVIVLADKTLDARALASLFLTSIPTTEVSPAPCRVDLYLDCCHSGAIAHELERALLELQPGPATRSTLEIGQVYCACLDDELSYELESLSYSAFTFAFLNECSRKQPDGVERLNLGLRDVGWFTGGRQHPFLMDFTRPGETIFKFPSRYNVTHPSRTGMPASQAPLPDFDEETLSRDPIAECLRLAHIMKDGCVDLERALLERPEDRVPFSRDELLTNRRFPFL